MLFSSQLLISVLFSKVEQSQLSQQSYSMSAAQSQILFDISYNMNVNVEKRNSSRSGIFLFRESYDP